MHESHWRPAGNPLNNQILADKIALGDVVHGGDQKLARMLELSGVPDLARAAWLSPVSDQGVVSWPIAQIGAPTVARVRHALDCVNAVPGFFSGHLHPFPVPDDEQCVICPVGDRSVGRGALFLHSRHWSSAFSTRVDEAIERVRHLVHIVWMIRGEGFGEPLAAGPSDELAEQYPFGVMVIDADQHVHLANGPARRLLAQSGAIGLMGDRIVIDQSTDAIRFQVALRSVLMKGDRASHKRPRTISIEGGRNLPLLVSISRLTDGRGGASRVCVIITRPGALPNPDIAPLAEYFSLTPVEIRVARELVKGLSVQDAAQALQLKVQTVRTYLKQIFQKTGTHRQAELMQLMLNGALPVLD